MSSYAPQRGGRLVRDRHYEIGYADGRLDKLHLVNQFVPFTALRERK
jgi:hypothetical protein